MSYKRTYSDITTQESYTQSYSQDIMPISKRSRRMYALPRKPSKNNASRSSVILKIPRSVYTKVYKFSRSTHWYAALNPAIGVAGLSAYDIQLLYNLGGVEISIGGVGVTGPNLPNASEFTNLFDQYRITNVRIEAYISQNTENTPSYPNPLLHITNDYNSSGSFSLSDMEQYQSMRTYQPNDGSRVVWNCRNPSNRADLLTNTGVTSTSAGNWNSWVDCSSPEVRYYGTRMFVDYLGRTSANDNIATLYLKFTYDLEFRMVK